MFSNLESGTLPKSLLKDKLLLPKAVFVGIQMVLLSLGLYKCQTMGLLPTSHSDWLAFKSITPFAQVIGAGGDAFSA